jgi:protein tyrosine phosphatase (PTP) superfamily phosphohydrolase (DUF442 family)
MTLPPQPDSAHTVAEICNYLCISDTVGSAGQPEPRQFANIRAAGYEVVINLAMPTSTNALPNEGELVTAQGMEYVHIPVVWENPTRENLACFFDTLDRCQGKKLFVHCVLNMRASVFIFLYRTIRQRISPEVAGEALLKIWRPDGVWLQFLNNSLADYGIATQLWYDNPER